MEALIPEKERRIIFCATAAAVVALQWLAFSFRIAEIEPEIYFRRAIELEVSADWRYGYVTSWHGAVLVKTPNRAQEVPEPPVDPEDEPDPEIEQIMYQELKALNRKAVLELGLYLGSLLYAFFGMARLRYILLGQDPGRWRVLISEILFWLGLWYILAMPLALWGYGTPLFTNCVGPGALSCTSLDYGTTPALYSITVTYGPAICAAALPPLLLAEILVSLFHYFPGTSEGMVVWMAGLLFFGGFGFLRGLLSIVQRWWTGTRGYHIAEAP